MTLARLLALLVAVVFSTSAIAHAQDRLIEQEPFDQVTFDDENGNAVLRTKPLELPGRRVPANPAPTAMLRMRLPNRPKRLYECEWRHIVEVKLFEQLILEEAEKFAAEGNFNSAFENYAFLLKSYPNLPGLNESIDTYLYRHAAAEVKTNRNEEALTLLMELRDRQPDRKGLDVAVERVAAAVITQRVKDERFDAARGTIALIAEKFPKTPMARVEKLRTQLIDQATLQRDEAHKLLAARQLRKAQLASHRALTIWPDLEGVRALVAELDSKYPVVMVGVLQSPASGGREELDHWASRRLARLLGRPLVELVGFSPEGGVYRSPIGNLARDQSGLRWSIQVRPGINGEGGELLTGYDVSRQLLALAAEPARPDLKPWLDVFRGCGVKQVYEAEIALARPHLRTERLLETAQADCVPWPNIKRPADSLTFADYLRPYHVTAPDAQSFGSSQIRFSANPKYFAFDRSQPQELFEQQFVESDDAVKALRRGEVDVLDRVYPWDVGSLSASDNYVVKPYLLPTVHVLKPNLKRAMGANRTLRRSLLYGINRQAILDQVVLGGRSDAGSMVVSGPFAAGASLNDPIGYGTDDGIEPAAFEPRMAVAMFAVALKELNPDRKPDAPPEQQKAPIILAHSADPIAQLSCLAIAEQIKALNIQIETRQVQPGAEGEYDFLYTELAAWEPIADARRVLGEQGVLGGCSPYMSLALAKLDQAQTWQDARRRLRDIHRLAAEETVLIPLWQTVNYYAHRRGAVKLGEQLVDLYQNVEGWKQTPPLAAK